MTFSGLDVGSLLAEVVGLGLRGDLHLLLGRATVVIIVVVSAVGGGGSSLLLLWSRGAENVVDFDLNELPVVELVAVRLCECIDRSRSV